VTEYRCQVRKCSNPGPYGDRAFVEHLATHEDEPTQFHLTDDPTAKPRQGRRPRLFGRRK
jgi:hypothetical protein